MVGSRITGAILLGLIACTSAVPLDVEAGFNSTLEARHSPLTITLYFDDHCGSTVGESPSGDPIVKVVYTGDDSTYMKCQENPPSGLLSYQITGGPTLDCGDPAPSENQVWQVFNGPGCKGDTQINTDQCKATACTKCSQPPFGDGKYCESVDYTLYIAAP